MRPSTDDAYYVIWIPASTLESDPSALEKAAALVQLSAPELSQAATLTQPVPVARANTSDQATALCDTLRALGIESLTVAARDLKVETPPKTIRALEWSDDSIVGITREGKHPVAWKDVLSIVTGRLLETRAEVEERRRRGRTQPVDARSLFADDLVLDIYSVNDQTGWRIIAGNFDFSCLGSAKKITAVENFGALTKVLREQASRAEFDDSYVRVRQLLSTVWPLETETRKGGWRRSGAGKLNTSTVTTTGNATQFTRYSRLRRWLRVRELRND